MTTENAWDATRYDGVHSFVWHYGQALIPMLAPKAGETILDVGCGTGHLSAEIAAAGARVVGIDASPAMIEAARASFPAVQFIQADAARLAFAPKSFDAVFSNAALHWMPHADEVARSIAAVLVTGGRFCAEMGGRGNIAVVRRAIAAARAAFGLPEQPDPHFFPSIAEYGAILEAAGFEVCEAVLFDRPTPLPGAHGLREWVQTFSTASLADVAEADRERFFTAIDDGAAALRAEDGWLLDYRRLRFRAIKLPR